jgi:hypothetical protein
MGGSCGCCWDDASEPWSDDLRSAIPRLRD